MDFEPVPAPQVLSRAPFVLFPGEAAAARLWQEANHPSLDLLNEIERGLRRAPLSTDKERPPPSGNEYGWSLDFVRADGVAALLQSLDLFHDRTLSRSRYQDDRARANKCFRCLWHLLPSRAVQQIIYDSDELVRRLAYPLASGDPRLSLEAAVILTRVCGAGRSMVVMDVLARGFWRRHVGVAGWLKSVEAGMDFQRCLNGYIVGRLAAQHLSLAAALVKSCSRDFTNQMVDGGLGSFMDGVLEDPTLCHEDRALICDLVDSINEHILHDVGHGHQIDEGQETGSACGAAGTDEDEDEDDGEEPVTVVPNAQSPPQHQSSIAPRIVQALHTPRPGREHRPRHPSAGPLDRHRLHSPQVAELQGSDMLRREVAELVKQVDPVTLREIRDYALRSQSSIAPRHWTKFADDARSEAKRASRRRGQRLVEYRTISPARPVNTALLRVNQLAVFYRLTERDVMYMAFEAELVGGPDELKSARVTLRFSVEASADDPTEGDGTLQILDIDPPPEVTIVDGKAANVKTEDSRGAELSLGNEHASLKPHFDHKQEVEKESRPYFRTSGRHGRELSACWLPGPGKPGTGISGHQRFDVVLQRPAGRAIRVHAVAEADDGRIIPGLPASTTWVYDEEKAGGQGIEIPKDKTPTTNSLLNKMSPKRTRKTSTG